MNFNKILDAFTKLLFTNPLHHTKNKLSRRSLTFYKISSRNCLFADVHKMNVLAIILNI